MKMIVMVRRIIFQTVALRMMMMMMKFACSPLVLGVVSAAVVCWRGGSPAGGAVTQTDV